MRKGIFFLFTLVLALLLALGPGFVLAQAVPVTVQVTASDGVAGVAGVAVRYGSGSNYTTAWLPGTPTGAGGTIGPVNFAPGTYSFQALYNNGHAEVLNVVVAGPVTVNFSTNKVILELKSSTGAYLNGGQARYGSGSTYTSSFWLGGLTGSGSNPTGQTIGELFPGTYSFEMSYNGTAEVKSSVNIPAGTTTLTWTTTNVTLQYSGSISFGGLDGNSGWFTKPSMELLPCTRKFHARTGGLFDLTISGTSMTKSIILLLLKDHNGKPLAGGRARGGNGSSYTTWWVPGTTDATYGAVVDVLNGLKTNMSYQMLLNNGGQVVGPQDVSVNSILTFQTLLVALRLETCGGAPLNSGNPRYGAGSTYTTSWWPGGTTGSSGTNGETYAELFAGIYSFEMQYQGTAEAKLSIAFPGGSPVVWQTTKVTLWYSGSISFGGGTGDSRWFNKPSMELMAGTYRFHFRGNSGTHPGGRTDFTWGGCSFEKTVACIRLRNSDGTPQPNYTAKWYRYDVGLPYLAVVGTPDANGVLLNAMDGYNNTYYAYHKIQYLNAESYSPLAQIPASNSFYEFQLTKVEVQLKDHAGNLISGTGPDVYFHTYFAPTPDILFGTLSNGTFSRDLLMGYRHYFTINNFNGTAQQIWQDNLTTPAVFQAFLVNDGGWGCTNYSQYPAADYSQTFPGSGQIELLPGHRIYYKNNLGATEYFDVLTGGVTLNLNTGAVARKAEQGEGRVVASELPTTFGLSQNYPNPFNPSTVIRVALPVDATMSLAVYNTLGQKVAELMNGTVRAGYHDVRFDATNLASGLYIYRMVAKGSDGKDFTSVQKMLLMK
jgi:hypothetical protein